MTSKPIILNWFLLNPKILGPTCSSYFIPLLHNLTSAKKPF